nr:sugar transferase [Algoriphagus aestuariicola]
MDLFLSSLMLIVFSPVFLFLFLVLSVHFQGSPFFLQKRPGKDAVLFQILKFKTMNDRRAEDGILLSDGMRITWLGKFVRMTSLDEIPQLINVLKGDMSLVGPRPLLPEYLELYSSAQKRRHEVRPGVTGLAQINGRNTISWRQKFDYDIQYVEKVSLGLDLKILFQTLWNVLRGKGVSQQGQATVGKFNGTN